MTLQYELILEQQNDISNLKDILSKKLSKISQSDKELVGIQDKNVIELKTKIINNDNELFYKI